MLPPKIDRRDAKALIQQMKEMAPFYTPEWRFTPEDPDPGTALFLLFADMYQDNIQRLNRVPYKNFVAFLNMLNVSQLPARPARAQVTFRLSEGVRDPVWVASGTQLSAAEEDGEIVFETERGVMLTPAKLVSLYEVSNRRDVIRKLPDAFLEASGLGDERPTALFRFDGADNLQQHMLYIGHERLFLLERTVKIDLVFGNSLMRYREQEICRLLTDPNLAEWLYATENGWAPFDLAVSEQNRITLHKNRGGAIEEREIGGASSHWIACRLRPAATPLLSGNVSFDSIMAKTDYADADGQGGFAPDRLFAGDVQGRNEGMYPFGEFFVPYGTFYIASQEAFSKREGRISIRFRMRAVENRLSPEQEPQIEWKLIMKKSQFEKQVHEPVSITSVLWEYWNGSAWVRLPVGETEETMFYRPEEAERELSFECPADLAETFVNGEYSYWIRARILQIENLYNPGSVYLSPWIENVSLAYGYGERFLAPERLAALNNTLLQDETSRLNLEGTAIRPFMQLDCKYPSLYFGFDAPPVRGPIHLYVSMKPMKLTQAHVPLFEWEYLGGRHGQAEWRPLKVFDETNGLTQSGTIQFAGPHDFTSEPIFGTPLYWLRAVNRDSKYEAGPDDMPVPIANGFFVNTTRVVQQETVEDEVPIPVEGERGFEHWLDRTPIVAEQVWIDETEHLGEEELESLEASGAECNVLRDSEGNLQRIRILWQPVGSLGDSQPKDRHYVIDRNSGKLLFGDGVRGMAVPEGGERIRVSYKVSAGRRGNVGRKQIAALHQSIAFVQTVENPEPAAGGCDGETVQEAIRRGPQLIKHRDRAVTADDFEWLAREAYPNIAKVKCLANVNVRMEREIGSITLVVLAKDGLQGGQGFPELKREVEKYMLERVPSVVAFPENIQVIEPAYLEISVHVVMAVTNMDHIVSAELESIRLLGKFLDPLTGGYDGKGWAIGQQLHVSVFYGLLKSIPAVSHVQKLYMTVHKLEDGVRTELDPRKLGDVPHGIVVGGVHEVNVTLV
ncbi:putative baseplate assembly protein [Paenibacillus contaminans]|uniref:Putative baseplate assembly protein n=1 Tax=Paenibacillus contaminans TaxID=450362 RepID=A0A329LWY7_9BACL|nr:putative baseplate assembly protein [Paenibacillus contaminans]RAV09237.1 putative baseplate assembly protein [Paenibacillus contaminans]